MTVHDLIRSPTCSSAAAAPLSHQVIETLIAMAPSALESVTPKHIIMAANVHRFLQPQAAAALEHAAAEGAPSLGSLRVNSMYRSVVLQVIMQAWAEENRCGVTLAAPPGTSRHESGLAIDVEDHERWRPVLARHNWHWFGEGDRVHFEYRGMPTRGDVERLGVKAFQRLAVRHGVHLLEDGIAGRKTIAAILAAPCAGWPVVA